MPFIYVVVAVVDVVVIAVIVVDDIVDDVSFNIGNVSKSYQDRLAY